MLSKIVADDSPNFSSIFPETIGLDISCESINLDEMSNHIFSAGGMIQ